MFKGYLDRMKEAHQKFIDFIDEEKLWEDKFQIFNSFILENKIANDKIKFKSILQMIKLIVDNHQSYDLFKKIKHTLLFYKDQIQNSFSDFEIFTIFETNKKILLFLINSKFIAVNKEISHRIINKKNAEFFALEIKQFNDNNNEQKDDIENFEEKRLIGENDSYICSLIRADSIKEFIIYVNKTNLSISSTIKPSIFETNSFLCKMDNTALIEYAAFYGARQIFQYLFMNGAKLTASSWLYVIHGRNHEMIHFLEEKHIEPNIHKILTESIKCHHNEITIYIKENLIDSSSKFQEYIQKKSLKYFNFVFISSEFNNFQECTLFKYNQTEMIEILSKRSSFNVNKQIHGGFGHIDTNILSLAIMNDNIELVKLLLSNKQIDVNALSYYPIIKKTSCIKTGISPLFLAIKNENIEIIKLLLTNDNININYSLRRFCEGQFGPFVIRDTPFSLAIGQKNNEILKLLLSCKNIDINYKALYEHEY